MFILSFCSKLLIWVPISFPSLLVPCIFSFVSLCIVFNFPFVLWRNSIISVPSWLPVSLTLRLIGCLSPHCLVLFLEFWFVPSFGPYLFVLAPLLCCKGLSLKYSSALGNPLRCIVALSAREGSEREQLHLLACSAPTPLSATSLRSPRLLSLSHSPVVLLSLSSSNVWDPICQLSPHPPQSDASLQHQTLFASCPSQPLLPVCMNISSLISWLSGFHVVWLSGGSGCFLFSNWLLSFFWSFKEMKHFYLHPHLGHNSSFKFLSLVN